MQILLPLLVAVSSLAAPLHAQDSGTVTLTFGTWGPEEWVVADEASGWLQDQKTGQYQFTISASPPEDPQAGAPLFGHMVLRLGLLYAAFPEDLVIEGVPGKYVATIDEGDLSFIMTGIRQQDSDGIVLLEGDFSATAPLKEPSASATNQDPLPVEGKLSVSLGPSIAGN